MALRNGLLVHGPTHWAAAVRTREGELKVASGRKPDLGGRASERLPGAARRPQAGRGDGRDPARQARAARGASCRCRTCARSGAMGAAAAGGHAIRSSGARTVGREAAVAPAQRGARRCWRCAAATSPPTTAWSTRRSPATRRARTPPTPTRSTSAAARTWSRRCWPRPRWATWRRAGRACAGRPPRPRWGWAAPPWRWRCSPGPSATPDTTLARLLRKPGFEIQRAVGTREPTGEQLEVGRAALAEILRAEEAAA